MTGLFIPTEHPHRRLNVLTGDYVLVSPHRARRPWQGQIEKLPPEDKPSYDPGCYLCPGNERAGGVLNPDYESTFVFTNDFSALLEEIPPAPAAANDIFQLEAVRGTCRVICFSPHHDLSLPEMPLADIRRVVDVWAEQSAELGARYRWVQVFENKGPMMGASNPHPHGQVWAEDAIPNEARKEDICQKDYLAAHGSSLLLDVARAEMSSGERLVTANEGWVAVVPFWATWPFETLLLPLEPVTRLPDLRPDQRKSLADILRRLLTRYDNLFEVSFPYSMGWHGAPYVSDPVDHWQLHAHFYPPLLRSATIRKFMVGYEMMAEVQRDLTPEQAAARLRDVSEIHFRQRG